MRNDIIIALATPHSPNGAIAIIRLSGEECIALVNDNVNVDLTVKETHTVSVCNFINEKGKVVDNVLVTVFKNGKSYTKEESVEISCHNSEYIIDVIIKTLIAKGARMALNGEFTRRAYLNGRFDIIQAEAVADLIAAQNESAHNIALKQMRGDLSSKLTNIREGIVKICSLLDLDMDFNEEDINNTEVYDKACAHIDAVKKDISALISNFSKGEAIKKGLPVAIIGKPNVGKSSFLNAILKEERCIVSDIPGTTRDTIDAEILLGGLKCRFIDTAGIREGIDVDILEKEGIKRTKNTIKNARLILYITDVLSDVNDFPHTLQQIDIENKDLIILVNKIDLNINYKLPGNISQGMPVFYISTKDNIGIKDVEEFISNKYKISESEFVVNARHYDILSHILKNLEMAKEKMMTKNYDIAFKYSSECIEEINKLFAEGVSNEHILDNIFKDFCIGK